jgi:hypothetical protein
VLRVCTASQPHISHNRYSIDTVAVAIALYVAPFLGGSWRVARAAGVLWHPLADVTLRSVTRRRGRRFRVGCMFAEIQIAHISRQSRDRQENEQGAKSGKDSFKTASRTHRMGCPRANADAGRAR